MATAITWAIQIAMGVLFWLLLRLSHSLSDDTLLSGAALAGLAAWMIAYLAGFISGIERKSARH